MSNIDDIIRAKAKSESLRLPQGFEERNDILITELAAHPKTPKKLLRIPLYYKSTAAAILIVLLLAGVSAAAYSLSGGGFFKQFFADKANNAAGKNYRHMNTEQLDNMASSTVGTVVDTDEITIDVMGVIISGNTAEIMLKVTANQLDTVLYDTGIKPLKNYRFNDDLGGSLFSNFEIVSSRYYYSDEDKSLAPNQFKILYTLIGTDNFKQEQYSIELRKFGYFTLGNGTGTVFKSLYDDCWQFKVAFDSQTDSSKSILINKEITAGSYSFILNKVNITPLVCTISLKYNQTDGYINKNSDKIYQDFAKESKDCSLTLKDGTILGSEQFEMNPSGGAEGYTLILTFNVPVTVSDISSMSIFGVKFALD